MLHKESESTGGLMEAIKKGAKKIGGNVPTAVLVTAGIAGIAAGMRGISAVYNKLLNDPKRKRILEQLIAEDPILRDADKDKLLEYYAVIYHVAPSITLNKGALREPLKNFVRFDKVDVATMKTLAELEDKMRSHKSDTSFISDMNDIARFEQTALSLGKTASDEDTTSGFNKLAESYYTHNKLRDRYIKGIESLNYFKDKGIM